MKSDVCFTVSDVGVDLPRPTHSGGLDAPAPYKEPGWFSVTKKWVRVTCPDSLRSCTSTRDRTRDLVIVSPTPYRSATKPPERVLKRRTTNDRPYTAGQR